MNSPIHMMMVGCLSIIGGLIGALAMNAFLHGINRSHAHARDMVEIAGRFFKHDHEAARKFGRSIHYACGAALGIVVGYALYFSGTAHLPTSIFAGMAVGLFLGMFSVFALMYGFMERHPSGESSHLTMQVGLLYLIGHFIYGAVTGLIVGFHSYLPAI